MFSTTSDLSSWTIGDVPMSERWKPCPNKLVISHWIEDCIKNHPECSREVDASFIPTRLIDVQPIEESQDVKLVSLNDQSNDVEYVALSHCWGDPDKRPLITTTENLSRHMHCIPFKGLPLTFQNAVELTRDLGHRYLWVDSLCIIQDDSEDWMQESSKMAAVYGCATITLSALSSADSTRGLDVPSPTVFTPGRIHFDRVLEPYRIRIFQDEPLDWDKEYNDDPSLYGDDLDQRDQSNNNPLRQRAWVLQERELSARNLHFSQNLLLWECRTTKATNELPWNRPPLRDLLQPLPIMQRGMPSNRPVINLSGESMASDGPVRVREKWFELMEDYMSRSLSHGADKLPALSGLAQNFQQKLPSSQYLAGLWSEQLPYSLLWRTTMPNSELWTTVANKSRQTPTPSPGYRAPSWSFLSLDGPISYESQRHRGNGFLTYDDVEADQIPVDDRPANVTILGLEYMPASPDPYSAITSASLLVHGNMVPLRPTISADGTKYVDPGAALLKTLEGEFVGTLYIDFPDTFSTDEDVWCVPVRAETYRSESQSPWVIAELYRSDGVEWKDRIGKLVMGLGLRKDERTEGAWRRVGLVRWLKRSALGEGEGVEFRMV
jgi:hypothetical protein